MTHLENLPQSIRQHLRKIEGLQNIDIIGAYIRQGKVIGVKDAQVSLGMVTHAYVIETKY